MLSATQESQCICAAPTVTRRAVDDADSPFVFRGEVAANIAAYDIAPPRARVQPILQPRPSLSFPPLTFPRPASSKGILEACSHTYCNGRRRGLCPARRWDSRGDDAMSAATNNPSPYGGVDGLNDAQTPLIPKGDRKQPSFLSRHGFTLTVVSVVAVFAITTVLVATSEWHVLDAGRPPPCSKGGIVEVMGPARSSASANETADPFVVIFSGSGKADHLVRGSKRYLFDSGFWRTIKPTQNGDGPAPRWKAAAARVDATTLVLMGGDVLRTTASAPDGDGHVLRGDPKNTHFTNDVWLLEYGNAFDPGNEDSTHEPAWHEVDASSSKALPRARRAHAVAAVGSTVYVSSGKHCKSGHEAAGYKLCEDLGDLWRLDLSRPSHVTGHRKATHRKWHQVWEFSPEANASHAGPEARHGHTMVAATIGGKVFLVMYGGRDHKGYFSDVWAFDVEQEVWLDWTPDYEHSPRAFPAKRDHHCMIPADADSHEGPKMVLFGGRGDPDKDQHKSEHKASRPLGDVWEFHFESRKWKLVDVRSAHQPVARFLCACTYYDEVVGGEMRRKMLIYGGDAQIDRYNRMNELWEYDVVDKSFTLLQQDDC